MIISNLVPSRTNHGLISIYSDSKLLVELSIESIEKFNLKIGYHLSSDEIRLLEIESTKEIYYRKSLNLISIRKRSIKEIAEYLSRFKLNQELIDEIVERLISRGYLNDLEFAKAFVSDRNLLNPTSFIKLTYLLRAKGISQEIIDSVIKKAEVNDFSLKSLIDKKRRITRYQDDKNLINYLMRQGFSYSDIKEKLSEN